MQHNHKQGTVQSFLKANEMGTNPVIYTVVQYSRLKHACSIAHSEQRIQWTVLNTQQRTVCINFNSAK